MKHKLIDRSIDEIRFFQEDFEPEDQESFLAIFRVEKKDYLSIHAFWAHFTKLDSISPGAILRLTAGLMPSLGEGKPIDVATFFVQFGYLVGDLKVPFNFDENCLHQRDFINALMLIDNWDEKIIIAGFSNYIFVVSWFTTV